MDGTRAIRGREATPKQAQPARRAASPCDDEPPSGAARTVTHISFKLMAPQSVRPSSALAADISVASLMTGAHADRTIDDIGAVILQ